MKKLITITALLLVPCVTYASVSDTGNVYNPGRFDAATTYVTPTGYTSDTLSNWLANIITDVSNTTVSYSDSHALVASDAGKWVLMTKATANTLTVNTNATTPIPTYSSVLVCQNGAGLLTLSPAVGVTFLPAGPLDVSAQYGCVSLKKIATDTWEANGAISIAVTAYSIYGNPTAASAYPTFTTNPVVSGNVDAASYTLGGAYGLRYPATDTTTQATIAIGSGSMQYLTATPQALGSTAVGYQALRGISGTLSTGDSNTALGYQALLNYTTGNKSTAVGYQALLGSSSTPNTGTNNTAVGYLAMTGMLSGTENTAIGVEALKATTTGSFNSAIGWDSCLGVTIGTYNSCVGYNAGAKISTGVANTSIGAQSMSHGVATITGGSNTAIGAYSMYVGQGAITNSTYLGYQTGKTVTTGSNNTFIGANVASTTITTGANNLLIGTGSGTLTTAASGTSNWMNIANAIYTSLVVPTVSSGFGTNAAITGTSNRAFTVNVGTGGTAGSGVVAFATAAPTGWACDVVDSTNSASFVTVSTPTSSTTVTFTNYSRTTGLAIAWTASDVLVAKCEGY